MLYFSFLCKYIREEKWLLGWSDKALFAIFENGHIAADKEYFEEFNSEKSPSLEARAAHTRQSFQVQKIPETLKMIFFLENLQIVSFYIKEQSPN